MLAKRWLLAAGVVFVFSAPGRAQPPPAREPDQPQQRMEWFYQQRAYPLGYIPAGARLRALERLEQMVAAEAQAAARRGGRPVGQAALPTWTLIGPRPIRTTSSLFVFSGRVAALAVDLRDSNVVYLGGAQGGVWKTTDGGTSWTPLTDTQPSLAIGSIALDPTNPNVVYVGTGEETFSISSYYGVGILKSTDGGLNWTHLPGPFLGPFSSGFSPGGGARIGSLAVHPTNGQLLLAAVQIFVTVDGGASSGIYRSTDGGVTWTNVLPGAAGTEVFFDPGGALAYAALGSIFGDPDNGVYLSADAGLTWTRRDGTGADVLPTADVGRIEIAIALSSPTTLYAGIQNSASGSPFGTLLGFFKTTDGGLTWTPLAGTPDYCRPQCWYDHVIRVDPTNPNVVFAGGSATSNGTLIRSLDAGASWANISFGANGVGLHVDQHAMAFSTGATKLYVGNDGGAWSTPDVAAALVNWTNLNQTLAITQFYPGHALHATDVNFGFGGTQDNGTEKYTGGLAWDLVTCGDGGWAAIDFLTTSTAYTTCQRIDIRKSTSNGNPGTWFSADAGIDTTDRGQFIPPFVMDPTNPQRLYFGTFRVYQTANGAVSWTPVSPDLTSGAGTLSTIAVAPSDPNVIWVGINRGGVQVTTNGGATWTDRSAGLPPRFVSQITVDSTDPQVAYLTVSGFSGIFPTGGDTQGHVFKTTNGGATWADISGNLPNIPTNDIVIDPDLPATLYVATDVGVFTTSDAGASWAPLMTGLPRVAVLSLKMHRPTRRLRAATHGRSVWDLDLVLTAVLPRLNTLLPARASAGGPSFTLVLSGNDFRPTSLVRWNGSDRTTSYVNTTEVRARIPAADIATPGTAPVTVFNPGPGGGASNALSFAITDFALSLAPASRSLAAGASASFTVTLTPQSGSFDNEVTLACAVPLPALTSCSFSPRALTPGSSLATSVLTVSTTASASALLASPFDPQRSSPLWALGLAALPLVGLALVARSRKQAARGPTGGPPGGLVFYLSLAFLLGWIAVQVACASRPRPRTPAGSFTITVTATAGSFQHSASAALTVQ